jgi:hypothetical protein
MKWLFVIILPLLIALTACTSTTQEVSPSGTLTETPSVSVFTNTQSETASEESPPSSAAIVVPAREIELVAKTLRGECYDEQADDKREVVKVICNRVSVGGFGDSIEAVVTAPNQSIGYHDYNEPTTNDYAIAREVLTAWYEGRCVPLSEYLYFSSASNHKNVFRREWKEASNP